MRKYGKRYDEVLLDAFAHWKGAPSSSGTPSGWIRLSDIEPGMVFLEDVRTPGGGLLIARGHEVTEAIQTRLENFPRELLDSLVRTKTPEQDGNPGGGRKLDLGGQHGQFQSAPYS